jgi:hypothetical protein
MSYKRLTPLQGDTATLIAFHTEDPSLLNAVHPSTGSTALVAAAVGGHVSTVEALLEMPLLDVTQPQRENKATAMDVACNQGNFVKCAISVEPIQMHISVRLTTNR